MYSMLIGLRMSTTPTRSWLRHAIFGQTGPPRQVDPLAPFQLAAVQLSGNKIVMLSS